MVVGLSPEHKLIKSVPRESLWIKASVCMCSMWSGLKTDKFVSFIMRSHSLQPALTPLTARVIPISRKLLPACDLSHSSRCENEAHLNSVLFWYNLVILCERVRSRFSILYFYLLLHFFTELIRKNWYIRLHFFYSCFYCAFQWIPLLKRSILGVHKYT